MKELPDLAEYGESYEEAYDLAVDTIETAAQAYAEHGRTFPVAQVPADDFSGRVTLRLPTSLHRSLSHASEDEGISLNQFLVNVLSYYSGFAAAQYVESRSSWRIMPKNITSKPTRKKHLKLVRSDNLVVATG